MKEKVDKPKRKTCPYPRKLKTYRHAASMNPKEIENMAKIGCTLEEMAAIMDCSIQTLETHFGDLIRRNRNEGAACLRRKQMQVAMSGNPAMLIWLGKHKLGQREDRSENVSLTDVKKMLIQEQAVYDKDSKEPKS